MEQVFKYVWIVFILVTLLNVYLLKNKFKNYIEEKPEREAGYKLISKNFLIFGIIPWIIIGIGNLSGQTKSLFDYIQPAKLNPFVLLFHLSIIIIWLLIIRFVFFKDGAAFLENHPGLIRFKAPGYTNENLSKNAIKIFVVVILLGGVMGMILMWNSTMGIPPAF